MRPGVLSSVDADYRQIRGQDSTDSRLLGVRGVVLDRIVRQGQHLTLDLLKDVDRLVAEVTMFEETALTLQEKEAAVATTLTSGANTRGKNAAAGPDFLASYQDYKRAAKYGKG